MIGNKNEKKHCAEGRYKTIKIYYELDVRKKKNLWAIKGAR